MEGSPGVRGWRWGKGDKSGSEQEVKHEESLSLTARAGTFEHQILESPDNTWACSQASVVKPFM